jgi:hypothetical protein
LLSRPQRRQRQEGRTHVHGCRRGGAGANDWIATSEQILQYYQSTGGLTGYVTGGWTGAGAGYPNAFGYIDPNNTGSVNIAPNITFDFTEIGFQQKTPEQALADWQTLVGQLSANSEAPIIVWPWHDYGVTNWDTNGTGAERDALMTCEPACPARCHALSFTCRNRAFRRAGKNNHETGRGGNAEGQGPRVLATGRTATANPSECGAPRAS